MGHPAFSLQARSILCRVCGGPAPSAGGPDPGSTSFLPAERLHGLRCSGTSRCQKAAQPSRFPSPPSRVSVSGGSGLRPSLLRRAFRGVVMARTGFTADTSMHLCRARTEPSAVVDDQLHLGEQRDLAHHAGAVVGVLSPALRDAQGIEVVLELPDLAPLAPCPGWKGAPAGRSSGAARGSCAARGWPPRTPVTGSRR